MAVTSMSRSSVGFGQERYNRASGVNSNLDWCGISTTPTGTYTDASGSNWAYWIFKATGSNLVVTRSGLVDFLVVGGGASGGCSNAPFYAGGGGAGGCRVPFPGETIGAGTYAVTVGGGGATNGGSDQQGNPGTNSSIGSLIVGLGGGAGVGRYDSGRDGGCGGGAGQWATASAGNGLRNRAGAGTYYQGFRGGESVTDGSFAGGGGGAGAAGQDSTGSQASRTGGVGLVSTIISTSIATAQAVGQVSDGVLYFAGGGGSASNTSTPLSGGAGGLGGGTRGSVSSDSGGRSDNAPANTGGGTGSADTNQGTPFAGVGGSGVVIVRTRI
jgi:hypothetical protein